MLSGADGVHVGQDDLAPADARRLVGEEALVGLSTHDLEQLRAGVSEPVSYLALGPVFESTTKSGHADPVGLATLGEACRLSPHPLVAIGGLDLERSLACLKAGVEAVAIASDFSQASDLPSRVTEYRQALSGLEPPSAG